VSIKILIIGYKHGTHIGGSFWRASRNIFGNNKVFFIDVNEANNVPKILSKINYHFFDKRPARIDQFNEKIKDFVLSQTPDYLLTTGISPVRTKTLEFLHQLNIKTLNFLTDDPWNPRHYSRRFIQSLSSYDIVFSPRRANLEQLKALNNSTFYLPFAYDPTLFFPVETPSTGKAETHCSDIMFAGGADNERLPYIKALIQKGLKVGLYGTYWERYRETQSLHRGYAKVPTLRAAIQQSQIGLCLVRRANRDGNAMRTFELSAVGVCMLTEDTEEHREIFGEEGNCVVYFKSIAEMVEKTEWLLKHPQERQRLAKAVYYHITQGNNTYGDRLKTMLSFSKVKFNNT